jgi:xanthine/uracil permease
VKSNDRPATKGSPSPPSLLAIIGGAALAPLLIGGLLALGSPDLGLWSLAVGLPVCLLALPVVIAIRNRVTFRLRNAVIIGVVMGLGLGLVIKIGASRVVDDVSVSGLLASIILGVICSTVAYGFMKAIGGLRDR